MTAKYKRIADELRHEIATGGYQDGQALPTEEMLRARFSVSRQTIRQAIAQLADDGLVRRVRGSGTYVAHGPRRRAGTPAIGVITTYITDYIFPSIVRGIEGALSASGCLMTLAATYNRVDHERELLQRFLASPIDGLIVEGTQTALPNPNLALYEKLRERNIPFLFINGYYPELTRAVHVVTDDAEGGRMAARALLDAGHARLGGVFKRDDMQGRLRHQGFCEVLERRGLPVSERDVLWFSTENQRSFLDEREGAMFLDGLRERVDALVCYNDEAALHVVEHLKGCRLPDDLSLLSFDNSAYASLCRPKLTSLDHPKDAFGRLAAEKLMRMVAGAREESAAMPWTLVERESVRER